MKPIKVENTQRRFKRTHPSQRAFLSCLCPWCSAHFVHPLWGRDARKPFLIRCYECRRVMRIVPPFPMIREDDPADMDEILTGKGTAADTSRAANRRKLCPSFRPARSGRGRTATTFNNGIVGAVLTSVLSSVAASC